MRRRTIGEQVLGRRVGLGYWCLVRQSGCQFLGCTSVANFSITFCAPSLRLFLSQPHSKGAITVTGISNQPSPLASLMDHYCQFVAADSLLLKLTAATTCTKPSINAYGCSCDLVMSTPLTQNTKISKYFHCANFANTKEMVVMTGQR